VFVVKLNATSEENIEV